MYTDDMIRLCKSVIANDPCIDTVSIAKRTLVGLNSKRQLDKLVDALNGTMGEHLVKVRYLDEDGELDFQLNWKSQIGSFYFESTEECMSKLKSTLNDAKIDYSFGRFNVEYNCIVDDLVVESGSEEIECYKFAIDDIILDRNDKEYFSAIVITKIEPVS